jgi:hypothetical protein
MTKQEAKTIWFDYVVNNKNYWANGFTFKRLEKVKEAVFNDVDIMWDLLVRHDGQSLTPAEMEKADRENFNHCIGNFFCNISNKMREIGLTKN